VTEPANDSPVVSKAKGRSLHARLMSARSVLQSRWENLRTKWHRLPRWRRRWIVNIAIGCAIEAIVHVAGHTYHFGPIVAVQNWGLDVVTRLSIRACSVLSNCPGSKPPEQRLILVRIDDETWRNPAWGGGEPDRAPREQLAELVDRAFQLGAEQVVLDIVVQDRERIGTIPAVRGSLADIARREDELFAGRLRELLTKPYFGADQLLILVRAERRPLPQDEGAFLPELRESQSVDAVIAQSKGRIVVAAPYFEISADQVLREWDLFRIVCERQPGSTDQGLLRVIPSVQLLTSAHHPTIATAHHQIRSVNHTKIATDIVAPAGARACAAFPLYGASPESDKERAQQTCKMQLTLEGHWDGNGTCEPMGHNGKNDIGLKEQYWNKVRDAFGKANSPLSELPHTGSVENRIVYRYTPETIDILSALPLLNASDDFMRQWKEQVQGRVVIIGQTFEEADDRYSTPLGRMPGVVVLANAIDSMAGHKFIREPNKAFFYLGLLATIVIVGAISALAPALVSTAIATVFVIFIVGLASVVLFREGVWLDFSAPIIAIQIERWIESIKERMELKHLSKLHDDQH
jgi:hypothetical protein